MRPPEWIALVYFGYIAATAALGPFGGKRRRVLAWSAVAIVLVAGLGQADSRQAHYVRDWIPGLYALLGYWLPGMLVGRPHAGFERWLEGQDRRVMPVINRFVMGAPRALLEYFELAYLCCYPLVPCAFLWLALHGWLAAADRYWTTVLIALFACYGLVPWLPTRPPRSVERTIAMNCRRPVVRRLNLEVLGSLSIQANTFPSGHAAGALSAAVLVTTMMPAAGAVVTIIAISIMVGSVIGRYHYAADAVAGAVVAACALACVQLLLA